MPQTFRATALSGHRCDLRSQVGWVLRWLLVLALMFDLLSAPLHRHHHEGVDSSMGEVGVSAPASGVLPYAHGHEGPVFVHAATAIRVDLSSLGQLPAAEDVDAPAALLSLVQRLILAADDTEATSWPLDRTRPEFSSYRSLPPAGRAPPLHT